LEINVNWACATAGSTEAKTIGNSYMAVSTLLRVVATNGRRRRMRV